MLKRINIVTIILSSLIIISCKSNNELAMERGIYFYENNNYYEAANQFNKVILTYPENISKMDLESLEILAQSYQQLALCQSKLAMESSDLKNQKIYFNDALKNIKEAERLATKSNKRQEYRKTLLGIKNQLDLLD